MKHRVQTSESFLIGAVLALSGGFMDAYSYLCRGEVFANAQTGNLLLLGVSLASGQWATALHYVCPIAAFVVGIALSDILRRHAAPIVSFHYGAQNHNELKSLLRKSAALLSCFAVLMCLAGETLNRPLSVIFVGYDAQLLEITAHAFTIFSVSFLCFGFVIFGSSFFTALGNGFVSAAISFLRTMVFQIAAVLIFPLFWGLDGIWWSIVAAEVVAFTVTLLFLGGNRKKYGYI